MKESGLEDIWQESSFYGEAVTAKVMQGKHYYRGDRGHRITLETLETLRFCKFLEWLKDKEHDHFNQVIEKMNNIKEDICSLFGKHPEVCWRNKTAITDEFSELKEEMQTLTAPFEEFISLGISKSEVFEFWNEYVEMVILLLKFIATERNSNWKEHLAASTEMVPYERAFDHLQYFRWGLIYLADMMNLPTFAPKVNTAFQINKHHFISRSSSKSHTSMQFQQTWL